MNVKWGHNLLVVVCFLYFFRALADAPTWHLIDGADLIFHEAGHAFFFWAPFWLEIAGGSIFQVALPLGIAAYSLWKRQPLAAAVMLMWAGQSLGNVSIYAGDALKQQLPLIADGATHDWNYLLVTFGLLRHTALIAAVIRIAGWTSLLAGLGLGLLAGLEIKRNPEASTPMRKQ